MEAHSIGLGLGEETIVSVFSQLHDSWNTEPSELSVIKHSARIICLSIDRYNVTGLSDIRTNECLWIGSSDKIAALGGSINADLLSEAGSEIVGSQAMKLAWPNKLHANGKQASNNKVETASMESAD